MKEPKGERACRSFWIENGLNGLLFRLERIEQLVELDKTLVYREGGPKRVAFVSGSRWLIKKGAVIHLLPRRHTLGVRGGLRHRRVYLFLFTDLLLIAKPIEGEKRFVVKDYCQRQFVEVVPLEPSCSQVRRAFSCRLLI